MNWPKILTKERVEPLTIEERGALLTGIVAIAEGLPIKKSSSSYLEMLLDSVRRELDMSKRNAANGKKGGNPALKGKAKKTEQQLEQPKEKPKPTAKPSGSKITSQDVEQEIAAYTLDENLRKTIREFVDYRKQSGHALTRRGFDLMLKKLNGLTKDNSERVEILNNSIIGGYQGIFPLKRGKNDGKIYGPNGVAIKPETEQLHDLDELF